MFVERCCIFPTSPSAQHKPFWKEQDVTITGDASQLHLNPSQWSVTYYLPQVDSSLLSCGLHFHLILETSSTQFSRISDWIQGQYNCDITLITVSIGSKSKVHTPVKKLLLLTHICSQPTYSTMPFAHHCNFDSSPPKSFLSSSPSPR